MTQPTAADTSTAAAAPFDPTYGGKVNPLAASYNANFYDYGAPLLSYDADALEPLPEVRQPRANGRGPWVNPPRPDGQLSPYYGKLFNEHYDHPRVSPNWDIHIYHKPNNKGEREYAKKVHSALRREFPEIGTYTFYEVAIGPHVSKANGDDADGQPIPMFLVEIYTTEQLGAVFSYLVQNRGPLSILFHPHTGDQVADHSTHATWLGNKVDLDLDGLRLSDAKWRATEEGQAWTKVELERAAAKAAAQPKSEAKA
ncbi:hypothetical protein Q8F55_003273 [Vanrija albida]|uniref:DOPA 4,5-dioxygenase n=1 Tax=Vanrija albida TaxID=181172 RepID=A0ABR3Q3K4_9TREE